MYGNHKSSMWQNIDIAEYRIAKYQICVISNRKRNIDGQNIEMTMHRSDKISNTNYRSVKNVGSNIRTSKMSTTK